MRAIVFGGSGFLGSHVADVLTNSGYEVSIFDLQPSAFLQDRQTMIIGDILDSHQVKESCQNQDFVYNFAGIADIDEAGKNPLDVAKINILGSVNILEAARLAKVKRLVFASSAYVFSNSGSFYRISKKTCESYIEEYQKLYNLDFTILRYGSLYGRRADKNNNIYNLIQGALVQKEIIYKGTGEELREYIHVNDAARMSVNILDEEYKNRHLILTGNEKMKVKDIMYMIKEILNNQELKLTFLKDQFLGHYKITPYAYTPTLGHKLTLNDSIDLGQGLLDIISSFE